MRKLAELQIFMFISFGNAFFISSHHEEFINLSSSNIKIHLSFFVLISLQNHCLVLSIDFLIEYSIKGSLNNLLLALNIGSFGTKKGNL